MPLAEALPNPYQPSLMRIDSYSDETSDVRTLRLQFADVDEARAFEGWSPGQFGQFTVFGAGESVFAISNRPWHPSGNGDAPPTIECTFRVVGKVTTALRAMSEGQVIGFRGPYGNHFPLDDWKGKHISFIGGGIGMVNRSEAVIAYNLIYDKLVWYDDTVRSKKFERPWTSCSSMNENGFFTPYCVANPSWARRRSATYSR